LRYEAAVTEHQERIAAFEKVLRERFDIDPESGREYEDWWRFEVDGVTFQGGIHHADVRVHATICSMPADVDIDAVYDDIGKTPLFGSARFIEMDVYLYASAKCGFDDVSVDRIEQMIRDCVEAAKSPVATSLRSKWRDW
jgi:hypothetical protein